MKVICEICKIPFEEDDLIDLRIDQYVGLRDEPAVPYDLRWVQICEPCYFKHSGVKKDIWRKINA